MKKLIFIASIILLLMPLGLSANQGSLNTKSISEPTEKTEKKEDEILERLAEIQSMDFKNMSREERKAIKNEMRDLKKRVALDDKVTISVGALIIIILLIIIIF